jgi:large conductance mechanosensitive channel
MRKMIQEFKAFAMRGNVVDMAVGVIIGGAFGKIVSSFVNDIIMPLLSLLTGGVHLGDKQLVLREAQEGIAVLSLNYGAFIQLVIDFLIMAWAVFLTIKLINSFKRAEPEPVKAPAALSEDILLLREIRDSLKK